MRLDLHLGDVGLWLRGNRGSAGFMGDWMILKLSSKPDASMILCEKLPQNLLPSFHKAHLNYQLWESAVCDTSHLFYFFCFRQKRRVSFVAGREGRAVPGSPVLSAAAAALSAPGPGLCKEPSYARNADFPYVTPRRCRSLPWCCRRCLYGNGGKSRAGGAGAPPSLRLHTDLFAAAALSTRVW